MALHVSEHKAIWDWLPNAGLPYPYKENFEVELLTTLKKKLIHQMESAFVKGEAIISLGQTTSVIAQEASDRKIDLIVLAHRGSLNSHSYLGSVTQKIVASSPVPVLVVKNATEIKKIGCLIDPAAPSKKIITSAEELAFLFSAKLSAISLIPDYASRFIGIGKLGFSTDLLTLRPEDKKELTDNLKQRIRETLDRHVEASIHVEVSSEKKLSFHLNNILEKEDVDLVLMKRHESELLEKILIGSETRRMLEIYKGNLLILPPSRE